jgi:DNA-binding transcriptional MerR regulator
MDYREYSDEMIRKLVLIKTLRNLSFSIEEIRICLTNETSLYSCFASKLKQLQGDKDLVIHGN